MCAKFNKNICERSRFCFISDILFNWQLTNTPFINGKRKSQPREASQSIMCRIWYVYCVVFELINFGLVCRSHANESTMIWESFFDLLNHWIWQHVDKAATIAVGGCYVNCRGCGFAVNINDKTNLYSEDAFITCWTTEI